MDPIRNPYAPGAGTPPPELAGRDEIRETARIALERARNGRPGKGLILVGLRGVGKTVLLDRIRQDAEAAGIYTLQIEASENRSLPAMLAPLLRSALLKLSRLESARQLAQRALRGLSGFISALKVSYQDITLNLDLGTEPGLADSGDLATDLPELCEAVGAAAQAGETSLAFFVDELQYVKAEELSILIMALHRMAQRQLPVIMLGAGLPQVRGNMGQARTYAERLFDFTDVGPLRPDDARCAIVKPAAAENVAIAAAALDAVVEQTGGYPYFLQEWGKHLWDVAERSPITPDDVSVASQQALATLDMGFFLVRFERLTQSERNYARAMAELGEGQHRSSDVAAMLGRNVQFCSLTRDSLIDKGTIWSPDYGYIAFTVPMFDGFMRRIMPGDDWRLPA